SSESGHYALHGDQLEVRWGSAMEPETMKVTRLSTEELVYQFRYQGKPSSAFFHRAAVSKTQTGIVGQWSNILPLKSFEFFKDGSVNVQDGNQAVAGNYRFVDRDHVRIDLGGPVLASSLILAVSVGERVLVLTQAQGTVNRYGR